MSAAPTIDATPTLLGNWACPFVQRVWSALLYKGVTFHYVEVDLMNKPDWFLKVSPLGKVPVITYKDDEGKVEVVHESLCLLEFVDEQYKGPTLLPGSPVDRARARILISRFDQRLVGSWNKLTYGTQEAKDTETALAVGKELSAELDWLQDQIQGPYMLGHTFSNADAAIAPWMLRAAVLEAVRGYKIFADRPKLEAYAATLRSTPAVQSTLVGPPDMDPTSSYDHELVERSKGRFKVHHFF